MKFPNIVTASNESLFEMTMCANNFWSLAKAPSIVLGITNSLIGIVAAFGNLLALYVFYKDHKLHCRSTVCLLSLVITDLLVGSLLQPAFTLQLFSKDARSMCGLNAFRRFITAMLMGASMSSIALISYDRYLLLSKASQYNSYMTPRRVALLIFLCWILPGLSPLLNYTFGGHGLFSAVIFVYTFVMLFVISWSYFTIMRIIRRNEDLLNRTLKNTNGNTLAASASTNKRRMRAARAIMVVLICFVFSNAPLTCYLAIIAASSIAGSSFIDGWIIDVLYVTTITITLMNSIINPIIYYFRIPNFRSSLLRTMNIRAGNRVSFASSNCIEVAAKKK